jgi:CheY-like chemotaxis protein
MTEQEKKRLLVLQSYQILDSGSEICFDDIARVASEICKTPIALISFIDGNRQWFKSKIGFDGVNETPREIAFCNHTIQGTGLLEIADAKLDHRFENNPLVTEAPHIRFYAGAPLIDSDGQVLGAICVVDYAARELSVSQKEALTILSRQVIFLLESRRQSIEMNTNALMQESLQTSFQKTSKAQFESSARAGFRVLVAEDNMINQEITLRMLKKAGYAAEVVANGKEVLAAVKNVKYDLVLMDCQMPEMDGYESTAILRELKYDFPIIALTANAIKENRYKCMSAGMNDFLTKPLYYAELIDLVDHWLALDLQVKAG